MTHWGNEVTNKCQWKKNMMKTLDGDKTGASGIGDWWGQITPGTKIQWHQ